MELRTIWQIIRRRWWIMIIPPAIVLLWAAVSYESPPTTYNTGVRFLVAQPPGTAAADLDQERYYNWLASEYIVNGLTDWVRGNNFAAAVSAELQSQGHEVPAYEIGIAPDNTRSMLTVSINHGDPERLAMIMDATITVLQEQNSAALPQLGGDEAVLILLDTPSVNPIPAGITSQLDWPLRLFIALAAGVALGLVVEYLDPFVHSKDDVKKLDLPLLGQIPKQKR